MALGIALPTDAGGRYFNGPNGKIPTGTTRSTDYADAHVIVVDPTTGVARPVGNDHVAVRVEKTRTSDTNAYAIYDAINESISAGTLLTFAVGRASTSAGVILGAHIATNQAACVAVLELDLYDASITAVNDNAEATRLYANEGKFIDTLVFPAVAKKTTSSDQAEAILRGLTIPFSCVGASSIYGVLRTMTVFTPASAQKFQVTLYVSRD